MREYKLLLLLAIYQKLKILWHFQIFVNTGPHGAGNSKTLLLQFIRSEPNFLINKAVKGEYKLINVLAICQKLNFVTLWIFNMGVNGKLKCRISRKRLIAERNGQNLRLGVLQWTNVGTFDARFLEFGLGTFGAVCKISDPTIFETLPL